MFRVALLWASMGFAMLGAACQQPQSGRVSAGAASKEPTFEIKNFVLTQAPTNQMGTLSIQHDYLGKGIIVTPEQDRSFLVTVSYKRKNLKTGLVQDESTGPYIQVKDGLGEVQLSCNEYSLQGEYPPCEITWTGISYVEQLRANLKNVTAAASVH